MRDIMPDNQKCTIIKINFNLQSHAATTALCGRSSGCPFKRIFAAAFITLRVKSYFSRLTRPSLSDKIHQKR